MNYPYDVVVVGAERQAAVSAALSRPDLRFLLLCEQDVVDGWDLDNVTIRRGGKEQLSRFFNAAPRAVVASPDWMPRLGLAPQFARLSAVMPRLALALPGIVLPVRPTPPAGRWILKGDARHWPDAPVDDEAGGTAVDDRHGCGYVYQERRPASRSVLVTGRRDGPGQCLLGIIAVHQEAFAREDFLLAGESIADSATEAHSRALLEDLDYRGHFSLSWLRDRLGQTFLTSFRPVPRATFQLFRAGGLDLLEPAAENSTLSSGLRFVVEHHYAAYR